MNGMIGIRRAPAGRDTNVRASGSGARDQDGAGAAPLEPALPALQHGARER